MRRPKTSIRTRAFGPLFLENSVGTAKGGAHDISVDRVFDAVARAGTASVALGAVGMVEAYWKRHGSLESQLKAIEARLLTIAAEM